MKRLLQEKIGFGQERAMDFGIRGRVALITAASSGLGAGGIVSRLEDKMAWQSVRHDPVSALAKTDQAVAQRIITLRRQRLTGQHIAIQTGVSSAIVSHVLKRFRQRLNYLKRSTLKFLRNSGRETGSHPRLRGGMLSLELL
jgi:NAD(P)-dependent dehydrogenase (short-subunit alcohol dehydrogenase family)